MRYLIYIILGFLPSIIWLVFYLHKDKKPEPKTMIVKIFVWGMLIAPLVIVAEVALQWIIKPTISPTTILFGGVKNGLVMTIITLTFIPAVAEEYLKYAVVKTKVIRNSVFDEPTDAMIYCIVSGLGFAAVENLLALLNFSYDPMSKILGVIAFRFIGATLLHTLASATVGYWLAMGILNIKHRKIFVMKGLFFAAVFHGCYNYLVLAASPQSLSRSQQYTIFIFIAILLGSIAIYVGSGFQKLKKQQSICKI